MRIGVDLGGTKIEAVALDHAGAVAVRRRVPTPAGDYAGTVRAVAGLVRDAEGEVGCSCTVGVGTPGAVSPATGRMKNCNSTCLNGQPLRDDLCAALGREVRLANDADCFALSEAVDGAGAGHGTVWGVILGTGVGGGIVVNGGVLAGPNAVAGEWGHNPLPAPRDDERPGPPCYCGRRGCVEAFLSGPAISREHQALTGQGLGTADIFHRAREGDAACAATVGRACDRLARALAAVLNILDPHVVVLGGGLGQAPVFYQEVPRLWGAHVFSDRVDTLLLPPRHGDSSGVRGAAWLWPRSP
jgi:predicted NBD/HSP70 family sugar kinase